jgi:putative ATPase
MANNTFQAVATIGYPESRIILSQCAYSPHLPSNASYLAIGTAQQLVKQTGDLPVPIHLRNAPTKLMKELMVKNTNTHMITVTILPNKNFSRCYNKTPIYVPGNNSRENTIREF